jgi:hypothetical protein
MKPLSTLVIILCFLPGILQVNAQVRTSGYQDAGKEKLLKMAEKFNLRRQAQKTELQRIAKERGWKIREESNTGIWEIQYVDERGFPQTYRTMNLNAGRTTNTDDIWSGGATGLNLTADGFLMGEWDGGGVRTAHQEFNNGAGTRVTQMDAPASTSEHSSHVAGTMIAEGQDASAHGMATEALLHAYDWDNDLAEMALEAADGLTLSNHSYGWNRGWTYNDNNGIWYWYGDTTVSRTEDYLFGFYDSSAQDWDEIAFNAPHYLIVKSSGNDRNDDFAGRHAVFNGTNWIWSSWGRDEDGGVDGYDCIGQQGIAKNILTVGAVNDIPAGWVSAGSVVQSAFSSWGPTDDGRIKPDLVANGVNVYSCSNSANNAYTSMDGTSMASPNTTGTLALLQDYYQSLRGGTMSAAALKGLAINTANEAGANDGPDYQNGWGLLNASGAASMITADHSEGGHIVQGIIRNGQTIDYTYYCNGMPNVFVTLCWTDPPGTPPAPSLNPGTIMLVNDLDVRLIKSSTTLPWRLNPAAPAAAATRADNFRDNVEVINLNNAASGFYTIRITHKGALQDGQQAYALIIRGLTTPPADSYCTARSTNWQSFEYITKVVFGSIDHSSGRSPGGYHDFSGLVNQMIKGATENLTVSINGDASDYGRVWIDWNQDGDFSDAGEEYNLGIGAGPNYSLNITTPMTALKGYTTMRVRLNFGAYPSACGTTNFGETEDYTIQVLSGCEASGGCDEYISRVQAGSINNFTGCNGYSDYTASHSTSFPSNGALHVTITNGPPNYGTDQCGIWVDWNRNGSFLDAGEQITVTGTPGNGPYTATIIPPVGQSTGVCVMRTRITYTGVLNPCGETEYGEVEDYLLNLTVPVVNQWIGGVSNDWFDPLNWSLEHIPSTLDHVNISVGYTFYPIVGSGDADCNNLTVGAGTKISIGNADLNVAGNLTHYGQLEETHFNADLMIDGSFYCESGSTANITSGEIWVSGNWEFKGGSNFNPGNGTVAFNGTVNQFIRGYSAGSSFRNLYNWKTAGILYFSSLSTDTLKINGTFTNQYAESVTTITSSMPVVLKGSFTNNGHLYCNDGEFIFNGNLHTINLNTGDYFNDLIIKSTGTTSLTDSLRVNGLLMIKTGTLAPGSWPITLAGNWYNYVGTAGFNESTGKVIFNGSGHQYVYCSETFNILEAAMGAALRVNNPAYTVTCNQYIWSSGGIDVLEGTFTALDLAQNGIFGGFWLNPGGTINLTNNDGYVDLNGDLHIYGGEFNVFGSVGGYSYWPVAANGGIEMTGGILDFKNISIKVNSSAAYTFSENITGGTIRTTGGFFAERPEYTPSGGTLELYGSANAGLSTINGGTLFNVLINKAAADNPIHQGIPLIDRFTGEVTEAPVLNMVIPSTSVTINGDLTIQNGTLSAGAQTINLAGNWDNQAGATGFAEGTSTVVFNGSSARSILCPETFYNLTMDKTYSGYNGLTLTDDISVTNNLMITDGTIELDSPSDLTISGDIQIASNAGLNANDNYGAVITAGKNWTNNNAGYSSTEGFSPDYSTVIFNGILDQIVTTAGSEETFYNLQIDKSAGKFKPASNLTILNNVDITNGTWEDHSGGRTHAVTRNFTVGAGGAFNTVLNSNTLQFIGGVHSLLTYGGASGYLRHLTINKNVGYSVTQTGNASLQNGGNMTVQQGYYYVNVNAAGYLSLGPSSTLVLTDTKNLTINSGGRFEANASSGFESMVRANVGSARYNFSVNSGATISAEYCNFRNMGASGLNIASGATVDPAHTFTGCTFQDGAAGGTLLTINNNQTMTIRNAVFPSNTWLGTSNVSKTMNQGQVNFVDYTGNFSGENFDNDAFNRLTWVPSLLVSPTAAPVTLCTGATSQLHANPSGGLPPYSYLWSPATGLSSTIIENPTSTLFQTQSYTVLVTDALGTSASANLTIPVNPYVPVSVTIDVSANPSPPGSLVLYMATPVNGGASPMYQWKVNGINAGTGLSTYSYVPSNGDEVSCVLTSNEICTTGNPAISNTIPMIIVNTNTTINGNVPAPLNLCFDASNTITVAGGGTAFTVEPGGTATMIAGQRILFYPSTIVQAGGYLHGYITSTHSYCGSLPPAMMAVTTPETEPGISTDATRFSIYPNPTSGLFTLTRQTQGIPGTIEVEIFTINGVKVLKTTLNERSSGTFDLRGKASGIYLIKITKLHFIEVKKLIIN